MGPMALSDGWSSLGSLPPDRLVEARLALHDAVQPMAAAAYALLPAPDDHSHSNLLWSSERGGFVGRALPGGSRCALDPRTLRTTVLGTDGALREELDPVGRTLEQVYVDLAAALRRAGESVPAGGLRTPEYDLPRTPVRGGAPFAAPCSAELGELARWFAAAQGTIADLSARHLAGAEVRGWPHHLDLAALRTYAARSAGEEPRSLGVGFSPGDESYGEPYLYVSPWPAPRVRALPHLPRGAHWHTQDFTSAILTAGALLALADGEERVVQVEAALEVIVRACRSLLET
jgi:hypothetical protein